MNTKAIDQLLPPVETAKNIGIFGGSFDPPHLGHGMMTLAVLMTQDIDEIWVLPSGSHPHKGDQRAFEDRVEMCHQTFGHIKGVEIVEMEKHMPSPTYTINTLTTIKELRPEANLHFIIGGDLVEDIPGWDHSEGLTELARFLIVPRQGYPLVDPLPLVLGDPLVVELGINLPELSSTLIGKLQKRGVSIEGFVEKRVHEKLDVDSS